MYNPLTPNEYKKAKLQLHRKQQAIARAEAVRPALPTSLNFFAEALSALPSAGDSVSPLSMAPSPLSMSAEELHRRRVSRSAALGIQTAVQLEKDELEVEQKKRKLEGSDAKSRIHSMLSKMRSTPNNTSADTSSSPTLTGAVAEPTPSMAGPSPVPLAAPAAPLVFVPSTLAAGGYVMATTNSTPADNRRPTQGKPSSTILMRYVSQSPLPQLQGLRGEALDRACGPLCGDVSTQCGRFGVVRGVRVHLLSDEEQSRLRDGPLLRSAGKAPEEVNALLHREQLRILVRFDTVASAFKATEELPLTNPECAVSFFPTDLFDNGHFGPAEGESLCG